MQKEIQKFLTEHLGKADFKLDTIKKGGSDRSFFGFACRIKPVTFLCITAMKWQKTLTGGH